MPGIRSLIGRMDGLLIWRAVLALALLIGIAAAVMLWFSGGRETADAFESGRRLVIALENGKISGHIVTTPVADPSPAEAPPAEALPGSAAPAATPEDAPLSAEAPPLEMPVAAPPAEPALTESPPADPAAPSPGLPPEAAPVAPPEPTVEGAVSPEPVAASPAPTEAAPEAVPVSPAPPEPTVEGAVSPEPVAASPAPPEAAAEAVPVSPEPPAYQGASAPVIDAPSAPAVLPESAPAAPLSDQPAPVVKPSSQKLPEVNTLLTEQSEYGPVPIAAQDGTRAWRYYAKPFERSGKAPMIAIIITGLGHNRSASEHALAMDEHITLSLSPYARDVARWAVSARLAGHEVMLDLPMEPANFPAADPGPYGLLTENPPEENESRLRWLMSRVPVSVGFITPANEHFINHTEHFRQLMQSLSNRGLMLAVTREPSGTETKEILASSQTPNVVADFIIDEDLSDATIKARLASLEQLALKRGYAVGIARPYPLTVAQIKRWLETLTQKGFVLVPVSAIAKLDYS